MLVLLEPSMPPTRTTTSLTPMNQQHPTQQSLSESTARHCPHDRRVEALGIRTHDQITTSYQTGPYTVRYIHGPFTHYKTVGSLIILDHLEISLALCSTSNPKQRALSCINNIRQVGERWFSASNDELFLSRELRPQLAPRSLLDIIDPPDEVFSLPIPLPYQLDTNVDYEAGPRRTWHCQSCSVDFNAIPQNRHWCRHNCNSALVAQSVYYVRAPPPDDRRRYFGYYIMELNSIPYGPLNSKP